MSHPRRLSWALALAALLVSLDARAQSECISGTGSNATYIFPEMMGKQLGGAALESGDVITAHDVDGRCVGRMEFTPGVSQAMAVWGDDVMTSDKDGMAEGEQVRFVISDASAGKSYSDVIVSYLDGSSAYQRGGINIAGTISRAAAGIQADVTVLLQGPYDPAEDAMSTALNANEMLPAEQPFSDALFDETPLDFDEEVQIASSVFANHPEIVDYVLLELRTGTESSTIVNRRAALLLSDGSVVGEDGMSRPAFVGTAPGEYYLVVRHRNHLGVMSAEPVDFSSGVGTYDFTTSADRAYGSLAMAELAEGRYGLYAGDANANGQIQTSDKQEFWWAQMGKGGYLPGDFNLNGHVQNSDKIYYWWTNQGKGSTTP